MRAVVQRVSRASVAVDREIVGSCGHGLLVLVGVARDDGDDGADRLARRIARLRVFPGETGRLDRSLLDVGGGALVVSQFTLLAETGKGSRPSFSRAAASADAERLVDRVAEALGHEGISVATGRFGAYMTVELVNDGPVTIVLDV
jgi:D-aminoacyl-tRNA deacylase